jgi:hypothetical protein
MENHFMEYLIPQLQEAGGMQYCHFFEARIKRICREEGFTYSENMLPRIGPGKIIEAKSSNATLTFGVRYEIGYSIIAGKPQILSKQYLANGKPMPKAPGRFGQRLDSLDARIRRLFPSEPVLLSA